MSRTYIPGAPPGPCARAGRAARAARRHALALRTAIARFVAAFEPRNLILQLPLFRTELFNFRNTFSETLKLNFFAINLTNALMSLCHKAFARRCAELKLYCEL